MGTAASVATAVRASSQEELSDALRSISREDREKVQAALRAHPRLTPLALGTTAGPATEYIDVALRVMTGGPLIYPDPWNCDHYGEGGRDAGVMGDGALAEFLFGKVTCELRWGERSADPSNNGQFELRGFVLAEKKPTVTINFLDEPSLNSDQTAPSLCNPLFGPGLYRRDSGYGRENTALLVTPCAHVFFAASFVDHEGNFQGIHLMGAGRLLSFTEIRRRKDGVAIDVLLTVQGQWDGPSLEDVALEVGGSAAGDTRTVKAIVPDLWEQGGREHVWASLEEDEQSKLDHSGGSEFASYASEGLPAERLWEYFRKPWHDHVFNGASMAEEEAGWWLKEWKQEEGSFARMVK